MRTFLEDGQSAPIAIFGSILQQYIYQNTGKIVNINLSLETEKEKELFIKIIKIIESKNK